LNVTGYRRHDELVARGDGDDNGGSYDYVCSICDDSVRISYVHDSDDMDDYDALVDEDWQVLLLIKKAYQSKRI
jgi:hypothetical protein